MEGGLERGELVGDELNHSRPSGASLFSSQAQVYRLHGQLLSSEDPQIYRSALKDVAYGLRVALADS